MDATTLHKERHPALPGSAPLHAHALAIGREAEERYRELAERMADGGEDTLAELFSRLAAFEARHATEWAKSVGAGVPPLPPDDCAWLDRGPRVPEARAFVYRMMTPRLALELALQAEQRAKVFFERIGAESRNASVRELAGELARDEDTHIAWVEQALASLPAHLGPSEDQPDDPAITPEM
jgi:rubrerythrin